MNPSPEALIAARELLEDYEIRHYESAQAGYQHVSEIELATDIDRHLAALFADSSFIDWIAAHWESQRYEKQTLLGGRAIDNPTGSFRDALRADIARHDVGAT